ncbi:MAG: hypothetical protein NXI09_10455 [Bacteroidetes bacterium]|nr:hypothetical protein [Bacteroidota bacterium]
MKTFKFFVILFAFFGASNLQAQFKSGEIFGGASLGLIPQGTGDFTIPPIGLMAEYAINKNMVGGFYAGYSSAENQSDIFNLKWRDNFIIVGIRGSYNYELVKNFDVYAGGFFGYSVASSVLIEGDWPLGTNLLGLAVNDTRIAAFVGARYLIDNRFGVFGELGYGISFINLGVTVNFGRHELPFM